MSLTPETKILVVDDMSVMRKMIAKVLSSNGYTNITQAEDGSVALKAIKEAHSSGDPFGLVVSDWNMPKMTGIELLGQLRGQDEFKKLPFLMVTAEGEKDNIVQAVQAGVSNFIVKPFTPEVLMQKILKIFK